VEEDAASGRRFKTRAELSVGSNIVRLYTEEIIALQRGLLREGKGDVASYIAKADAYFGGYKWQGRHE